MIIVGFLSGKVKQISQFLSVVNNSIGGDIIIEAIVSKYRTLYQATRTKILAKRLTTNEVTTFKTQLDQLSTQNSEGDQLTHNLIQAYQDLINANLTYSSHQLFFVLNLNQDHTTIALPVSQKQLTDWQNHHNPNATLFTQNAFLFNGLSIDEIAAEAIL